MDLSVVIVSWNVREKLEENLKVLQDVQSNLDMEIFVVDNNSSDDTVRMVKEKFSNVKLIANKENLGFAKANNQAIIKAQGEFILLLNPDMKVNSDTLTNMLKWMRSKNRASVASCKLVDGQGKLIKHVRRFPQLWDQLMITLKIPHLFPAILNKYLYSDFDYESEAKVDSIRGSFFMIRRGVIKKIGELDEKFFIWFEEVDYCKRVEQAGLEVWYTPMVECVDYVGQSFNQVPVGEKQKYFRNSMLHYFKKYHPIGQYYVLKLVWVLGIIISWVGEKFYKVRIKN